MLMESVDTVFKTKAWRMFVLSFVVKSVQIILNITCINQEDRDTVTRSLINLFMSQ